MTGGPRGLAALLATLLLASPARAQQVTDAQQRQAEKLVKAAITKSQAGEHAAAIKLYLEAYQLVPLPVLLSNVGTEYQTAKQPVEALKYYCMYLERDPTGPVATYATAQARVVQTELGNPVTDADVCKPAPPTVTPPVVESPTPVVSEPRPVAPPDATPGRTMRITGLGVAAAGVVSLGVGVVFGLKAKGVSDEISDHCMARNPCPEWPANIKDREADGQRFENIQVATMIMGGALLVVGGIVYVAGRSRSQTKQAERLVVAPTASLDSFGVTLRGGF